MIAHSKLRSDKTRAEKWKDAVIGPSIPFLSPSHLPTLKVILQRWRSMREEFDTGDYGTISNNVLLTELVDEIVELWDMAMIPTKRIDNVKLMLSKAVSSALTEMKHTDRDVNSGFQESLERLFDISKSGDLKYHMSKLKNPKWEIDHAFYENQCKVPQEGCMIGLDKKLAAHNKRRAERKAKLEDRRKKEQERRAKQLL